MTTLTQSLRALPPKLALTLALQEKARRAKTRQRNVLAPEQFIECPSLVEDPNHPLHDLKKAAPYKIYYGGRGSAKSWGFAEELVRRAAFHPILVLCTREYQSSIADSVHRLLEDTIYRLGLQSWFTITNTKITSRAGAEFIFKGLHHNINEIKSLEGVDICWIEEGQSLTKETIDKLVLTIRKDGSEIWIAFNPENEQDPVYQRFVKNPFPGSIIHHLNYDSNPYFTQKLEMERQYYLKLISDASTDVEREQEQANYDHIWLGKFKKISKDIIFSGKYVVEEFDDDLWKQADRLRFGADFGFAQDPSTLIRFFILNNVLYIEYEAYGVGVELDEMEQFYGSVPESKVWPIKADSARPETISHMRRRGFNIDPAEKWNGSVEDGIAHIRGYKKIVIHPRCKHTADEASLYKYKKDSKTEEVLPIVIDKHNHCWDAIRYGLDGEIQRKGSLAQWAALAA